MKFTKLIMRDLALPAGKREHIYWDEDFPGFGARLRSGGSRVWVYQYKIGAKQRRVTLGHLSGLDLEKARKAAGEVHAKARLGIDAQAEKRSARASAHQTFGALVEPYLTDRENDRLSENSMREMRRYLRTHWKPLHEVILAKVSRKDISAQLSHMKHANGATASERARVTLSGFYSWAVDNGHVEDNLAWRKSRSRKSNQKKNGNGRNRTLITSELAEIWNACEDDEYGKIVRLLILTLQRREEIAGLRWSEVDPVRNNMIALPGFRTKNSHDHLVPLSAPALDIVRTVSRRNDRELLFGERGGPFSGFSKAKKALSERILKARRKNDPNAKPMPPWTLHGLRHTGSTGMNESPPLGLGIQPHIVEAVLNHISGTRGGVAGVYNKALYLAEKRAALDAWADYVLRTVNETLILRDAA